MSARKIGLCDQHRAERHTKVAGKGFGMSDGHSVDLLDGAWDQAGGG